MSKQKLTMYISLGSNLINLVGNIIGVYILKAGVAGVAYPSLLARAFSAIVVTYICFNPSNVAYYTKEWLTKYDFPFSGPLSNGLRATGDTKFTMVVSILLTVLGRFVFSII